MSKNDETAVSKILKWSEHKANTVKSLHSGLCFSPKKMVETQKKQG